MQRHHDEDVRHHRETNARISAAEDRTEAVLCNQTRKLQEFFGFMGRQILARLDFVAGMCIDVKSSIGEVLSVLMPMATLLGDNHRLLMGLQWPVEQHFVFEDATGRSWNIYMTNISDWESFDFFLEKRFRGRKGARRVLQRRFVLQERSSHLEIDRAVDWETLFISRQSLEMSLLCRDSRDQSTASSCPWCKTVSSSDTAVEVQW